MAVTVLFAAGMAQATSQSYSIVNYPGSEWDYFGTNLQDMISGTIIADPSLPDGENILSATFTLSQPSTGKSYTSSYANTTIVYNPFGLNAHVTSSAITVSDGLYFPDTAWTDGAMFELDGIDTATGYHMEMHWNQAGPQYSGVVLRYDPFTQFLSFGYGTANPINTTPDNADIENQVSTWVVATTGDLAPVPEPLTMIALGMGIAGLGGYIRRRRAVAK